MSLPFNYYAPRARQARLARVISSEAVGSSLVLVGVLLAAGGFALVWFASLSLGWFVVGLAGPFWMAAAYGFGLRELPPNPRAASLEALVDADVLGLLPAQHSPKQLADIATQTHGGRFFIVRFEIGPLLKTLSAEVHDSARIWDEAINLMARLSLPSISSAVLTAALLRTLPGSASQLAPYKINEDDLIDGVRWYEQMNKTIAKHKARHSDGGVGRDWSFGYTPVLQQFAQNISDLVRYQGLLASELPSREGHIKQIFHLLSSGGRHNATLVGPLGSGKTTLVHSLAEKLAEPSRDVPKDLHFRQVLALDPSSLISRARGRGELEELVRGLCHESLRAKNIVLFLDDAQLFFEEGNGAVDLSNVILPFLEGGALKIILTMDEQRWTRISQGNPALAQYLNRIVVKPTDKDETLTAMQDQLLLLELHNKVVYTFQSLEAAYRLSSRYLSDQAMPGKAVRLLESAATMPEAEHFITEVSVAHAIEQTQGVKVATAETTEERQTLLNLEQLIHQRMINQSHAVQVVSDALRRARSGVRNTNRPIGTFLFLGPTGVGKTELAKSVAAVFFGGEDHMVRLDLNEYVRPDDVTRLIADASQDSHSLTAQIAHQPFSVVLLDEIEKAHPNVLGTLLQMLDEGILRDINNREVSFRDAVVIATSNAGAERIREHIQNGQQLEQFEQQFTDELISTNVFRPEFLNRFDEIVLFRPLNQDELMQVVDIILQGVNKNLAAQKISVAVEDEAKRMLVQAGYDPRLGARPMRRVVQRVVENIVSNQLLSGQVVAGGQVRVTTADVQTMLSRTGN
ncbi:MAG TPA: ATP-dependent Clp protease ATP-binding subunit [Candidatus Saccharimonadales bacterium]|nr:ATP-dependent Clp protease ATP-binding subunit [Candidatus Saccharimonadales bacterium]